MSSANVTTKKTSHSKKITSNLFHHDSSINDPVVSTTKSRVGGETKTTGKVASKILSELKNEQVLRGEYDQYVKDQRLKMMEERFGKDSLRVKLKKRIYESNKQINIEDPISFGPEDLKSITSEESVKIQPKFGEHKGTSLPEITGAKIKEYFISDTSNNLMRFLIDFFLKNGDLPRTDVVEKVHVNYTIEKFGGNNSFGELISYMDHFIKIHRDLLTRLTSQFGLGKDLNVTVPTFKSLINRVHAIILVKSVVGIPFSKLLNYATLGIDSEKSIDLVYEDIRSKIEELSVQSNIDSSFKHSLVKSFVEFSLKMSKRLKELLTLPWPKDEDDEESKLFEDLSRVLIEEWNLIRNKLLINLNNYRLSRPIIFTELAPIIYKNFTSIVDELTRLIDSPKIVELRGTTIEGSFENFLKCAKKEYNGKMSTVDIDEDGKIVDDEDVDKELPELTPD